MHCLYYIGETEGVNVQLILLQKAKGKRFFSFSKPVQDKEEERDGFA